MTESRGLLTWAHYYLVFAVPSGWLPPPLKRLDNSVRKPRSVRTSNSGWQRGRLQEARESAEHIVHWYLRTYWQTPEDGGLFPWLGSERQLGHMAVDQAAVERGEEAALFKALITLAMFQRLRDDFVARILKGLTLTAANAITHKEALLALARRSGCPASASSSALTDVCDLAKDTTSRQGCCSHAPEVACYLKEHTVLLKRYGHFGKMPTSAALVAEELWGGGLVALRERVFDSLEDEHDRALELERELSRVWRVSSKVSAMFVSAIAAPDMGLITPPWHAGLDWRWSLPIDVNVDKFLVAARWEWRHSYDARRQAILKLSEGISLSHLKDGIEDWNPRLVLQAINRFFSLSNRRGVIRDCASCAPTGCAECPAPLRSLCPVPN